MSKYRKIVGSNTWGSGSGFQTLTEEQALSWCDEYLKADDYDDRFPGLFRDADEVE